MDFEVEVGAGAAAGAAHLGDDRSLIHFLAHLNHQAAVVGI